MTVIFWAAIPVAAVVDGGDLQLPLDGWYPFDTTKKVVFILTWTQQVRYFKKIIFLTL